jgi:hypothetical protein
MAGGLITGYSGSSACARRSAIFSPKNLNVNTPLSSSNQHDVVASGGSISALLNPPRTTPDKQAEATAQCQALISDE